MYLHVIVLYLLERTSNVTSSPSTHILNVAMFGMTAAEWKFANKDKKGNIRDYATMNQLICLANIENLNSVLITHGVSQEDRLIELNQVARQQMSVLEQVQSHVLLK